MEFSNNSREYDRGIMGIRVYEEPQLDNPVLIAGWPGIGNIGLIAVDTLKEVVGAKEFAELEPWELFYPKRMVIRNGELDRLDFPINKFYFAKTETRDFVFFIGEEQPAEGGRVYAEGNKGYEIANLVMDVAVRFGCRRVYTSGAAVAPIHHTMRSRVWAVPNNKNLLDEVRRYENTVLMSDVEGRRGEGSITGLNGLLLGVAGNRGVEAICVMGEIPVYLQGFPIPYPKASKSVLEVWQAVFGIKSEMRGMAELIEDSEREIEALYTMFPSAIREQLDRLRHERQPNATEPDSITDEDKHRILEDVDKFFQQGFKGD